MSLAPERPDPILSLLAGRARAQAVSTAASLGLADHLGDREMSLDALATAADCVPDRLRSLLRVLIGVGLIASPAPDTYALTTDGQRLRRDQLGPLAAVLGLPFQWEPWGHLREAMRGGKSPFEQRYGETLYEYLAAHPEDSAAFDTAIDTYTRAEAEALSSAYEFQDGQRVVDVGGGRGTLLRRVLQNHPKLQGTLFDLPHVVGSLSVDELRAARIQPAPGDFREEVPSGDVLIVRHVLHNWADDAAVEILTNCARAVSASGHVLVMDAILTPDDRPDSASMLDLEMLTMTGGRERRKPELRRLIRDAGLRIERFQQLTPACWLMVATRAPRRVE